MRMMSKLRARRDALTADDGFTLIELLVCSLLMVVVLGVVGGIFLSSSNTQTNVQSVTSATTHAQALANGLSVAIRDSEISPVSATAPGPNGSYYFNTFANGDQIIIVEVLGNGSSSAAATETCEAWYYSSSAQTVRTTSYTSYLNLRAPTSSQLATWSLVASNITPASGTLFTNTSSSRLSWSFKIAAGKDPSVSLSSSAMGTSSITGSFACY